MRKRTRTDGTGSGSRASGSRVSISRASGSRVSGRVALLAGAALAVASIAPLVGSESASAQPAARVTTGDVIANLWEWNWPSIAKECTDVLGPAGYGGVQVAPPQDSLKRTELGNGSDTILHPWWEVYQPVDYGLTSRMGDEAQFRTMVSTCRRAGVKVYVDAVINHMTGQGSVSYGGVSYSHFSYPDYSDADFHHKGEQCDSADGGIDDYNNVRQVFNCELVGLADLDTSSPAVQAKLAGYLNTLIGYGVSGFRVDAAKHIGQTDLAAIEARLHRTKDGTRPYIALEVFGGGPGVLSPFAFQGQGSLLGLDADKQLRDAFNSYPDDHVGSIATLRVFGAGSGLTPSAKSLVFVQNHDTERNGDALNYKTEPGGGRRNILANEFVLGYGYGRPQVFSSFAWTTSDDSPPATADGLITDTDCSSAQWVCTHRDTGVLGMVGWHNQVGDAPVANWWDDGQNVIAFSRGHRGWLAMDNDLTGSATRTFDTGLPAGTYCDVIHGSVRHGSCSGPTVKVDSAGRARVSVAALDAVAFSVADRVA